MFSTIFLIHTTLLLGYGQLHQQYGIDQRSCKNELFRTARILEETSGAALTTDDAKQFSKRIVKACYNNRIAQDAGLVDSDASQN